MIVRIVKMSFIKGKEDEFLNIFETSKLKIRNFEGCRHLSLLRDVNDQSVFFTYSLWDTEEHLNQYRQSDFFNSVWTQTKTLFHGRADAWSTELKDDL